jgi:methylthioribulose-1-phosphate dehydratase
MTPAEKISTNVEGLIDAGREFYRRGWVLGTSGNFSSLIGREPFRMCITASGNAKGELDGSHFVDLDKNGAMVSGAGKPSAESSLHIALYEMLPNAASILHTHSVWGTILSDVFFEKGAIEISGYEMLKGLSGVTTHEHTELVPIIENSQDYEKVSRDIVRVVSENKEVHGVYLRRHGLYTWGDSIADARRHIEIFEFLFEVLGRRLQIEDV